jgi:hypothetical protein
MVNGDLTDKFEVNGGKQGDHSIPSVFITACEVQVFALLEDHPDYDE